MRILFEQYAYLVFALKCGAYIKRNVGRVWRNFKFR